MVVSLTSYNKIIQPNNFGLNVSIGTVKARARNGKQLGVTSPQLANRTVIPAASSATNIAAAQALVAVGYLTLAAGTGVVAIPGVANYATGTTDTVYIFTDSTGLITVPRNVSVTIAAGGTTSVVTVWGYDEDSVFMTENITAVGAVGATVTAGLKAFAGITRIYVADPFGGGVNISVGGGSSIGLPYVLDNINKVLKSAYGTANATTAAVPVAAVLTSPATATTGDIRGTVPITADGTNLLSVVYEVGNSATAVSAQTYTTVFGVAQYWVAYT